VEYHTFSAMSTTILSGAEGSLGAVNTGFRQVEALVRAHERRFTRFSEQSELCALNRSAGTWFDVSPEMYEVLRLAVRYHQETEGLFDPSVLAWLEQAGYDRSIELVQAGKDLERPDLALPQAAHPDFHAVELADDRLAVRLPPGMRIDLGGIAKGWIAEQAAHLLNRYSPACAVNAGGDQYACGLPYDENGWQVGLEDPFDPQHDLAVLTVGPGAVATSSMIKRRWKQGKSVKHHLIDPRTGEPAHTPWASVTVITDTAARAEVLAKALLIAGQSGSERLMARHPESAFIAIDLHGNLWGSENSKEYLYGTYSKVF
jgi:thiamine biosynthesis lipoprotein